MDQYISSSNPNMSPFVIPAAPYWHRLSDAEKYHIIAINYLPWLLEFKKSWELYPEKFTVEYNELISDTLFVIQNLTEYVGIKKIKRRNSERFGKN